eukprot:COSAG05_NODE_26109_length_189_cov_202.736264_1_plen_24_part_01
MTDAVLSQYSYIMFVGMSNHLYAH